MVQVQVAGGTLRGLVKSGIARYLGIPYASAPYGDNRLKPPAPVQPWDGVRDATAYGPTVPKSDFSPAFKPLFPEPVIPGEECLNLNVWAPEGSVGCGALPVLVFVHGGAFVNGPGALSLYDGSAFARDGVVCVTVNYRLGAEGFLFTEADGGTENGNIGLKDQIAALRWVQDNIASSARIRAESRSPASQLAQ